MSDKTGPAWGRLAIEQYLLVGSYRNQSIIFLWFLANYSKLNWDFSSTEIPDQQRSRLATEFLNLNILPLKWFEMPEDLPDNGTDLRQPTTEEVDIILRPYRSEELRCYAMNAYRDKTCPHLLRTHYSANENQRAKDDEQMERWIDTEIFSEEAEWAVLDNENIFNFGTGRNWRRIYDILPELAGPLLVKPDYSKDGELTFKRVPEPNDNKNMYSYFRRDLTTAKKDDPDAWRHDRNSVIESTGISLQKIATSTYIIIADEEAFLSGSLLVVYLDGLRRVIREGRIDQELDDIGSIVGSWMETADLMEYSTLSGRYQVNGDLGRELYQLTEEDLTDL